MALTWSFEMIFFVVYMDWAKNDPLAHFITLKIIIVGINIKIVNVLWYYNSNSFFNFKKFIYSNVIKLYLNTYLGITVTCHLIAGISCANAPEGTQAALDGTATAHPGCVVRPTAPGLQACAARHCAKHQIKCSTRKDDAIKRRDIGGCRCLHDTANCSRQSFLL